MPRPNPPPTPGSSTDIRGKEGSYTAPAFNLPPTAFADAERASSTSSNSSANGSDSSYRPVSPTSPQELSRKRIASQAESVITKDDFSLPPPPTRSRKIIQMKPGQIEQPQANPPATSQPPAKQNGKKKQGNGQTAAGRKIARKTAHSLIERRRRSKMNEEFGVLKDMIPACQGQEMHKLAILQASIDYLRYLEKCVTDLKAQNGTSQTLPPPSATPSQAAMDDEDDEEMSEADDAEDNDDGASTPQTAPLEKSGSLVSLPSLSQLTSTMSSASPAIFSTGAGRHYSISSTSPSFSPYIHSNQASPAFGPQLHHASTAPSYPNGAGAFSLTSPALKPIDSNPHYQHSSANTQDPAGGRQSSSRGSEGSGRRSQHELDQEATAALLMLNHDRRGWRPATAHSQAGGGAGSGTGGGSGNISRTASGMSVRDLLSG